MAARCAGEPFGVPLIRPCVATFPQGKALNERR
nr:MAG TPA: hypothetical protein [Caudoviricetes sp.]